MFDNENIEMTVSKIIDMQDQDFQKHTFFYITFEISEVIKFSYSKVILYLTDYRTKFYDMYCKIGLVLIFFCKILVYF